MKKALDSLERAGERAENAALVLLLAAMVFVAVFQIINRELLGSAFAIPWADEFVRYIVLWLALVGSIAACRENRHIRIDAITHIVSGKAAAWIKVVVDAFAAAVCAVLAWQAWRLVREEMSWGEYVIGDVPLWLAHSLVPLAFLLISYRFIVRVVQLLHGIIKPDAEEAGS